MIDLTGKSAIVTGGGRCIGSAICLTLAGYGANVAVADVLQAESQATAEQIDTGGTRGLSVVCNVAAPEDVERMFQKVIDSFGGVQVLVNNAGITRDGLMVRMSDQDWDAVMDVNLRGAFNCCRAAANGAISTPTPPTPRAARTVQSASRFRCSGTAGRARGTCSTATASPSGRCRSMAGCSRRAIGSCSPRMRITAPCCGLPSCPSWRPVSTFRGTADICRRMTAVCL